MRDTIGAYVDTNKFKIESEAFLHFQRIQLKQYFKIDTYTNYSKQLSLSKIIIVN